MANITLEIATTGERISVSDINLDIITNRELLTEVIEAGFVPPDDVGSGYRIIGKGNYPIHETATLAELGFYDGDVIRIIAKVIASSDRKINQNTFNPCALVNIKYKFNALFGDWGQK